MDAAAATPLDALAPAVAAPTASNVSDASRAKIHKTSQDFEASFLQVMLGTMFQGQGSIDGSFSGGQGEQAFRSFLTDAMAKGVVKAGGIGLSQTVEKELLKMQGAHA